MQAPDGSGQLVPYSERDSYLRRGYKFIEPQVKSESPAPVPVPAITSNDGRILVNKCSLKELVDLPLLGTASAKAVVRTRPHADITSLIEKVPSIDWVTLADRLSFEE